MQFGQFEHYKYIAKSISHNNTTQVVSLYHSGGKPDIIIMIKGLLSNLSLVVR